MTATARTALVLVAVGSIAAACGKKAAKPDSPRASAPAPSPSTTTAPMPSSASEVTELVFASHTQQQANSQPRVFIINLKTGDAELTGRCDERCRDDLVGKSISGGKTTFTEDDMATKFRPAADQLLEEASARCVPTEVLPREQIASTLTGETTHYVELDNKFALSCTRDAIDAGGLTWLVTWLLMNFAMAQP